MDFAQPLFVILISCGITFISAGIILRKFPPRNINHLYGYRTPRSMKSKEAWDFAQIYSARQLIIWGIVLSVVSLPAAFVNLSPLTGLCAGLGPLFIAVFFILIRTERTLQNKFSDRDR